VQEEREEEGISMNLSQLIRAIEGVAMQQPSVNMVIKHDIFRINSAPDVKYGVFAWVQGQHTGSVMGLQKYSFSLFYADRLMDDGSNMTEVQSVGVETLGNILRQLENMDIEVADYTIQSFNQRFTDECAGVFCNVSLSVLPESRCEEIFTPVDDFLIY
jgi:hypothetical protein